MKISIAHPVVAAAVLAVPLILLSSLAGCDGASEESTTVMPENGSSTGDGMVSSGTTAADTSGAPPQTSGGMTTQDEPNPTPPGTATGMDAESTSTGPSGESESSSGDGCPRVQVNVELGETLNLRSEPSTATAIIGSLGPGHIADVLSEATGDELKGTDLWYEVQTPVAVGYVASPFVTCTTDESPPVDPDGFYLPLQCGESAQVIQGFNGAFSHTGLNTHGIDLDLAPDTPLVAMADGVVALVVDVTEPGDPCYDGGGQECRDAGNRVVLRHADGTLTTLLHLNRVDVAVGDAVPVGSVVGLSGNTGWSSGPHLHFQRMVDCVDTGALHCQSIDMTLQDFGGGAVPEEGHFVASGNCP